MEAMRDTLKVCSLFALIFNNPSIVYPLFTPSGSLSNSLV